MSLPSLLIMLIFLRKKNIFLHCMYEEKKLILKKEQIRLEYFCLGISSVSIILMYCFLSYHLVSVFFYILRNLAKISRRGKRCGQNKNLRLLYMSVVNRIQKSSFLLAATCLNLYFISVFNIMYIVHYCIKETRN